MIMESVIKWQTGNPKKECECIVTLKNGDVVFNDYRYFINSDGYKCFYWSHWNDDDVIAWYPLSRIEPYTE
jgi:hypothetical protein